MDEIASLTNDHRASRSLFSRIRTAALWTMVAVFVSQFLRIASNLVLTRFLAPDMFGIMAIVSMVQFVLFMLADVGLREAIIQSHDKEHLALYHTAWTLQVLRGVGIWLCCIAVAAGIALADSLGIWPAGSTYASPELPIVLAVTALSAIISGFQSNKVWLMDRGLNARWGVLIDLSAQLGSMLVVLTLAWYAPSIWALVIGGLLSPTINCLASHLLVPGPANRFEIDKDAARHLFHFGIWIMASSLCFAFSTSVDKIMLGWWLAPAIFGQFAIAQSLLAAAETVVTRVFNAVATPALSEVARKDPETLKRKFFLLRLPFDAILMMAAGGLFASGSAVIGLILDKRYAGVGPLVEILSFMLVTVRYQYYFNLYLALGLTKNLTWISATRLAAAMILIPLGYHVAGLTGALSALASLGLVTLIPIMYLGRGLKIVDVKFEFLILLLWLPGYAMGWLLSALIKNLAG